MYPLKREPTQLWVKNRYFCMPASIVLVGHGAPDGKRDAVHLLYTRDWSHKPPFTAGRGHIPPCAKVQHQAPHKCGPALKLSMVAQTTLLHWKEAHSTLCQGKTEGPHKLAVQPKPRTQLFTTKPFADGRGHIPPCAKVLYMHVFRMLSS